MMREELEKKYSTVIGDAIPPDKRAGLESELVSSLRHDLEKHNTVEEHYIGDRLRCWKIIGAGGRTRGEFSTYQYDSGQIDSSLTFTLED